MTRLTPPKSPVVTKKKPGCMWGLYSLFNLRQGRSDKKLISYRKGLKRHVVGERNLKRHDMLDRLEGRCQGIDDKTKNIVGPDFQNKNKLAGDEVSSIPCHTTLRGRSEQETVRHKQPSGPNLVEKSSNKIGSAAASREKSFKQSHRKKWRGFGCRNVDFVTQDQIKNINLELVQMKDAAEEIVNQKLIDGKYISSNGVNQQSKQLLDALQILNKNKELFTKLLQDPNSLLVKHIQNLRDSQNTKQKQIKSCSEAEMSEHQQADCCARQHEEPASTQKSNSSNGFHSKGRNDAAFSERIIVLKPDLTATENSGDEISHCSSPQTYNSLGESAKNIRPTYFPFGHVARKLRHAMGVNKKDHQLISTVDKTNRYPHEGFEGGDKGKGRETTRLNSQSIMHFDVSEMEKSSNDIWKRDDINKLKGFKSSIGHETTSSSESSLSSSNSLVFSHYKRSESKMDPVASKHLSDVLKAKYVPYSFSQDQTSKTWHRKTDYLRIPSFESYKEYGSCMEDMRFFPYRNCQLVNENNWKFRKQQRERCPNSLKQKIETSPYNKKPNNYLQFYDTKSNISENCCAPTKVLGVDSGFKGCVTIVEATDSIDNTCTTEANDIVHTTNSNEEYEYFRCFKQDSSFNDQQLTSSDNVSKSSPSRIERVEDLNAIEDSRHQSSPVSVLEQLFTDETSPESTLCNSAKVHNSSALSNMPLNPDSIRELLQVSSISWDELLKEFHEIDQLFELVLTSLLNTAKVQNDQFCDNYRLIIDCIKDVLLEAYHNQFILSPFMQFIKPNFQTLPVEKFVIAEVTKCIDLYLLKQPTQKTMEELVEKDLTKSRTWPDILHDVEDMIVETAEDALEELIMETILEFHI